MNFVKSTNVAPPLTADLHKSEIFFFHSFKCLIFKAGTFNIALGKVGLGDARGTAWLIPPPAAETVFTPTTKPFPFSRELFFSVFNVEKGRCLRIFNKYC